MWSGEGRQRHDRRGLRYLRDAEWALIAGHIPPARRGGRRREVDVREVLQGVLHVLEAGCQRRHLPKDFRPRSTVWAYFDLWRYDGTLGRMLRVVIHPANIQDRDGAAQVLDKRTRRRFPFIETVFADQGYQGPNAAAAIASTGKWRLEIVRREPGTKGFAVLLRRWIVERTLSWIRRNRRLARGYEHLAPNSRGPRQARHDRNHATPLDTLRNFLDNF